MPAFSQDLAQVKSLSPKNKLMIFILLVVLFAGGLGLGFLAIKNRTAQTEPLLPTKNKKTSLSLSPASQTLSVNQTLSVSVNLSGKPVTVVDAVLTFNPQVFSVSNIQAGQDFPELLRQEIESNKLIVSAAIGPGNPAPAAGQVFSFTLTALKPINSAVIDFDPINTVTAQDGQNTLGETIGAQLKVQ